MYEGNKINLVTQYNYLGTIIVNHLNLNENINHSYKPASPQLKLLECFRSYLTVDATITVYLSMIVPIMIYSSTIQISCKDTKCKKMTLNATRVFYFCPKTGIFSILQFIFCSLVA